MHVGRRNGSGRPGHRRRRLDRGDFDLVGVGRALLQDPDWVLKIRDGRTEELKSFERAALGTLY